MTTRILLFGIIAILCVSFSCSEDIPDCPSRMCLVAGGWQLVEVFVDNEAYSGDLSQYRLTLNMPSPTTATTSDFNRVSVSGDGTWSLENDEAILRLVPDALAYGKSIKRGSPADHETRRTAYNRRCSKPVTMNQEFFVLLPTRT